MLSNHVDSMFVTKDVHDEFSLARGTDGASEWSSGQGVTHVTVLTPTRPLLWRGHSSDRLGSQLRIGIDG